MIKLGLTNDEKNKIMRLVHSGPYSRVGTHDDLEDLLKDVNCSEFINDKNYNVSTKQLQILLSTILILKNRLDSVKERTKLAVRNIILRHPRSDNYSRDGRLIAVETVILEELNQAIDKIC